MVDPSSSEELEELMNWAFNKNKRSTYIRLCSIPFKNKLKIPSSFKYEIGKGYKTKSKGKLTILTYGPILINLCCDAINELNKQGIDCSLINLPFLNYVDNDWLSSTFKNQDYVFHFENHFEFGGQSQIITKVIAENNLNLKYFHKYISDIPPSGTNNEVLEKIGLSLDKIINFIKKKLNES